MKHYVLYGGIFMLIVGVLLLISDNPPTSAAFLFLSGYWIGKWTMR